MVVGRLELIVAELGARRAPIAWTELESTVPRPDGEQPTEVADVLPGLVSMELGRGEQRLGELKGRDAKVHGIGDMIDESKVGVPAGAMLPD